MKWPSIKSTQRDNNEFGHSMPAYRNAGTTACRYVTTNKQIINT